MNNMHLQRLIKTTVFLLIIISLASYLFTLSFAQTSPIHEIPPTISQEEQVRRLAVYRAVSQAYYADFWDNTLEDYSIAYFISASSHAIESRFATSESMTQQIPNLRIITNTEDFNLTKKDGYELQFDMVIIHPSAITWIDEEWMQRNYRSGMPITTINLSFEEHQRITGDRCTTPSHGSPSMNNPIQVQSTDKITTLTSMWVLDKSKISNEEIIQISTAELINCKEINTDSRWYSTASYRIFDILTNEDLSLFGGLVLASTATADASRNIGRFYDEVEQILSEDKSEE